MRHKIRQLFEKNGLDAIIIRSFPHTTDPNFAYFAGLSTHIFHNNWLIIEKNKKPLLLCSTLEQVSQKDKKRLRVVTVSSNDAVTRILEKKIKNKKIGIPLAFYPYSSLIKLKRVLKPKRIVDVAKAIGKIRSTKTKEEIKKIKTACNITEEILAKVPDMVRVGRTEKDISIELLYEARKGGAEKLAFPTIVAFGKNAAIPHHQTSLTKIRKGNYLLVDFGVKFAHYSSDISRTFFVGKPTEEQEWNYWLVHFAKQKAFQAIQPGVPAKKVFQIANKILKKGFGKPLPHALGHGLGIEEHDWPQRIGPAEEWKFEPNQVFALEPAIYVKNKFGIRIEDDCLVTKTEAKWLSKAPKELVRI
ncbi:Xaa-Pro peptidase family protein [Candidatus Micrarchaeota archaeon]|nr:Xaa-Pro peptidase family protein [Candidatus Micrarchaeota archaeon]MBU1930878.1 Xaa-Pro peptidase family protein [Candidatus Micrarchaeota archaeon]